MVEEERWMWKRRLRRQEQRQGGAGVDQQVAKLSRDQYARPSLRPHPLPSLPLHLSPPEEAPSCSSSSSLPLHSRCLLPSALPIARPRAYVNTREVVHAHPFTPACLLRPFMPRLVCLSSPAHSLRP